MGIDPAWLIRPGFSPPRRALTGWINPEAFQGSPVERSGIVRTSIGHARTELGIQAGSKTIRAVGRFKIAQTVQFQQAIMEGRTREA